MKLEWFGNAGHFIGGHRCQFHLCTLIKDKWLVSTVGEYIGLDDTPNDIGWKRKYETMVFAIGERCCAPECMCGLPSISGPELDFTGYNNAGDAANGHMALVKKWSRKRGKKV
jgi:hypothetical protein